MDEKSSEKTIWILDGHHREKALKELEADGVNVADTLPATMIECQEVSPNLGTIFRLMNADIFLT